MQDPQNTAYKIVCRHKTHHKNAWRNKMVRFLQFPLATKSQGKPDFWQKQSNINNLGQKQVPGRFIALMQSDMKIISNDNFLID